MSMPDPYQSFDFWDSLKKQRLVELQYDELLAGSPAHRADLLARLHTEYKTILHIASDIMSSRNACAPVSALPAEILHHTFTFAAENAYPRWRLRGGYDRELVTAQGDVGWIAVARVCRRWRHVCYTTPRYSQYTRLLTKTQSFAVTGLGDRELKLLRAVPIPSAVSWLRTLRLEGLSGLKLSETLGLLSQTPLLEDLSILECKWVDHTLDEPGSVRINLSRLRGLTMDHLYVPTRSDAAGAGKLFRLFLNCLLYPHDTARRFRPTFSGTPDAAQQDMIMMQSLVRRIVQDIQLHGSLVCACLDPDYDDDEGRDDIMWFRPDMVSFEDLISHYYYRLQVKRRVWPMSIVTGALPTRSILADSEIVDQLRDVTMLSLPFDSLTCLTHPSVGITHAVLFDVFSQIRVLQTSVQHELNGFSWTFLSQVLDPSTRDGFPLPLLEELWLCPIIQRENVMNHILSRMRQRVSHPENRLHTLRLHLKRPPSEDEEGHRQAVELEALVHVIWSKSTYCSIDSDSE
ncbi:unnamed protein product [Peniophora sp. CBMAI 1063]|nr:unnamed protein product [Peniophora sp. CBMAI 1063]